MNDALPFLQASLARVVADGKNPSGSFILGFQTESDGSIRMVLEMESELKGEGAEDVVSEFIKSATARKWKFPTSASQSLVEVKFSLGST